MAIQVNKIGVDKYTIQINEGGEIFLNPGLTGSVSINGDVSVAGTLTAGTSTSIDSEDLVIYDNTITINKGETGPGVTGGTSGLIIDRGTRNDAYLFFDETKNSIRAGASIPGAYVMQDSTAFGSNFALFSLYSSGVFTGGEDLRLVGSGDGVVTVTGTTNYESKIWNYSGDGDDIPEDVSQSDRLLRSGTFDDDVLVNVRGLIDYVKSYHLYNFQDRITHSETANSPTYVLADSDTVTIYADNQTIATFSSDNKLFVQSLKIGLGSNGNVITSADINGTVILQGTGTGDVQVNDFMNLTVQDDTALSIPDDGVVLYSKTQGDGGTGLYFKNQQDTQDELISRNKSLLYSIIF